LHDRHIKKKQLQINDLVLLYDSRFMKFPDNIITHWMGPYQVTAITDGGTVELKKLDGTLLSGKVNGIRLNQYRVNQPSTPKI